MRPTRRISGVTPPVTPGVLLGGSLTVLGGGCKVKGMETKEPSSAQDVAQEPAPPEGKKHRGKPFTGTGDPRNGPTIQEQNAKKVKTAPVRSVLPEDGASQRLQDMRHVYLNDVSFDETEAHHSNRAWKLAAPRAFGETLMSMEKAHQAGTSAGALLSRGPDVGTAECVALVEKLIEGLTNGKGASDGNGSAGICVEGTG